MSRCSRCPNESCGMLLFQCDSMPNIQKTSFSQQLLQSYCNIPRCMLQAGSCPSGVVFFFWCLSGVVKHIVHLIRWNLKAVLANWGRLDHGPGKGITHDLQVVRNWVLFLINCFGFLVCHQLVPHLVPNFPRVPLRNVSWGLGVCAVLVRSVSPCRLVPEVRLFPSPPCAVFWPSARRVSAFFFLLPFRVFPGLPGVCVCNIWIDVKLFSFFFPLLPFSNNAGGWRGHMRLHPTKLLIWS